MKFEKSFIKFCLAAALTFFGSALKANEPDQVPPQDLKSAFQSLKKSMKQVVEEEAKPVDPLDAALEHAFNPVPDEILDSNVNLDRVDTTEVTRAWKEIHDISINDDMEIEYRQYGTALSLLLWSGSRNELQNVLTNILKQLYSDRDSRRYRFIVNSSPIPSIEAKNVDLNSEKREIAERNYKREASIANSVGGLTGIPRLLPPPVVPVKDGVEITISAGLLSTLKNVDELAGQLAKVLATLNPGIYGVKEDVGFTRNQKYFDLINQIVEGGTEDAHKVAQQKRDQVIAELSAIERLAAGGFNPWALYYYEERVFSWMADVFLESPNHSLGRFLVDSDTYQLKDWSRPLRLQLQSYYMAYLQSKERGRNMRLVDTEWTGRMKYIRLRMKLYTKPFFSGMIYQMGVVGGITAGYLFFPEVAHWALTALHMTTTDAIGAKEVIQNPTKIGEIAKESFSVSKEVLDSSYLSAKLEGLSAYAKTAIQACETHFNKIALGGGALISAGLISKYRDYIAEFLNAFVPKLDQVPEEDPSAKKKAKVEAPEQESDFEELSSDDKKLTQEEIQQRIRDAKDQVEEKIVVMIGGTSVSLHTRLKGLGQYLKNKRFVSMFNLQNGKQVLTEGGERLQGFWATTQDKAQEFGDKSKKVFLMSMRTTGQAIKNKANAGVDRSIRVGNALVKFAEAGKKMTVALSVGAVNGTVKAAVSSWDTLVKVAKAAPDAIAEKAKAKTRMMIGVGKRTAVVARDVTFGTAVLGLDVFIKVNHFIFFSLPVGLTVGTYDMIVKNLETRKQNKLEAKARREKLKAEDRALRDEIQKGKDRIKEIFESSTIKPSEVYWVIVDLDRLSRNGYQGLRQYGIGNPSQVSSYIFSLLKKWVEQANQMGATWNETLKVIEIVSSKYNSLDYQQRNEAIVKSGGLALIEFMMKDNLEEMVRAHVRYESSKHLSYLADMLFDYDAQKAKLETSSKEKSAEAIVRAIGKAGVQQTQLIKALQLYKDQPDVMLETATSPEISQAELAAFLATIFKNEEFKYVGTLFRYNFRKDMYHLSAIRKVRIAIEVRKLLKVMGSKSAKSDLNEAFADQVDLWVGKSSNITQLSNMIEEDCKKFHINAVEFRELLLAVIMKRIELITNYADFQILFEKEYFWSNSVEDIQSTPLERPLVALLKLKREQFGDSPAWKYDPIVSERIHGLMTDRLKALNQYPKEFAEIEELWKTLTSRGVSTITDDLLGQLLKMGNEAQIKDLEIYAVKEGRVFDQGLRDEFAIRQIKKSNSYLELMSLANKRGVDRKTEIYSVLHHSQSLMNDLGIRYVELLEEISNQIHSTYEEAEMIHQYKAKSLIQNVRSSSNAVNDSRLRMLHEILPYIKKWSAKNQYEFLLYLRGSIEATDMIKKQFPKFGPERIRKIYQGLPLESATAVVNLYLQETILARKEVNEGYGKKLIQYLVKSGADNETQKYAGLLLEGLLVGIDRAQNKPFQKQVLSALIAMKPNETASVGETMKLILEQFPGVGPKIGQFLVATGLLPDDINQVLRKTQDQTLPPKRFDIYSDLSLIVGNKQNIGVEIVDLLGSGSLKYSMRGREIQNGTELALQVFREDVQNNAELQIKVLNGMINYLIEKDGKKWAFLQVIVDGAMSAVAREKRFDRESQKTAIARNKLYAKFSDADFTVAVPEQDLVNDRLLVSRYAKGGSFFKLSREDQVIVAKKLLEMESNVMYSKNSKVSWYDTDRHAGNYLIDVGIKNGRKHYVITPIDFGQLTYIRHEQRQRVAELFAFAAMLGNMGSNDWLVNKIADVLQMNQATRKSLHSNLKEFFPLGEKSTKSVITSYFTLIAAINESVRTSGEQPTGIDFKNSKLDLVYTDFVRAIIQLNQYEQVLDAASLAEIESPRKILESSVKDHLANYLQDVQLSRSQEIGLKLINFKKWLIWKASFGRGQPEFVDVRMNREQLDKFSLDGEAKNTSSKYESLAKKPLLIPSNGKVVLSCDQVFSF